jgi:hypothetical protein
MISALGSPNSPINIYFPTANQDILYTDIVPDAAAESAINLVLFCHSVNDRFDA